MAVTIEFSEVEIEALMKAVSVGGASDEFFYDVNETADEMVARAAALRSADRKLAVAYLKLEK